MFSYFTSYKDGDIAYPLRKYTKWRVLKNMYLGELSKAKLYYRDRGYALDNDNILVRLIKTLYNDYNSDILSYMDMVSTDAPYIAKQFLFVSNLSEGAVLKDAVFHNSNEIFLVSDNHPDPYDLESTWMDYAPIKIIKTEIQDVYYPVPFKYEANTDTVNIFEIDIVGLMLQYYYWARSRVAEDRGTSPNVFLASIAIPNVVDSLIDLAIWNRFVTLASGGTTPDTTNKHPMYLIDYTKGVDDVLWNVVKDNTDSSIYLTQLLKSIPTLVSQDMYTALTIDQTIYNKQSKWVLWVSRMHAVRVLYDMLGKRGHKLNRDQFYSLPYELKLMGNRESQYSDKLGSVDMSVMKDDIDHMHAALGKR